MQNGGWEIWGKWRYITGDTFLWSIRKSEREEIRRIYNYISDYVDGAITREQFWVLAKFKYPTHQINFCTKRALKCLEYRGYEEVK